MLNITITGNIGKDAEIRSTNSGEVCGFSVGVRNGTSRDAETLWFRCSIWGQRGSQLVSYLIKGAKVAVTGQLKVGEYEGKPQFDINVSDIDPFLGGKRETGSAVQNGANASGGFDSSLDDDVPFLTAFGAW